MEKLLHFALKQHPLVPKHFEIRGKTLVAQGKTANSKKGLSLEGSCFDKLREINLN